MIESGREYVEGIVRRFERPLGMVNLAEADGTGGGGLLEGLGYPVRETYAKVVDPVKENPGPYLEELMG